MWGCGMRFFLRSRDGGLEPSTLKPESGKLHHLNMNCDRLLSQRLHRLSKIRALTWPWRDGGMLGSGM